MTNIKARNILYTPCNRCSKCPYDCNHFDYIIDLDDYDYAVPIPKPYKKDCYEQLEVLNI